MRVSYTCFALVLAICDSCSATRDHIPEHLRDDEAFPRKKTSLNLRIKDSSLEPSNRSDHVDVVDRGHQVSIYKSAIPKNEIILLVPCGMMAFFALLMVYIVGNRVLLK